MKCNQILIIRTGALGDVILTLPVIQSLRSAFPRAQIQMLGKTDTLTLAQEYINRFDSIDHADWAPFFIANRTLPPNRVQNLSATDLVLSYLPDPDGIFTANLRRAGAQTVISYPPHPPEDGRLHTTDHLLRPLMDMDLPVASRQPQITLEPAETEAPTVKGLADHFVAIHPGSGGVFKRWPSERFAQLADHLIQIGWPVVLLSGPADGDLNREILDQMSCTPTCMPQLPLRHLAAVLQRATVYLGNDSGPSHLSAAVGTPTLALFGPTDPRIWAPRGKTVHIIQGDLHSPLEQRLKTILIPQVLKYLHPYIHRS
ncbi:MAG: glycosyltransferase family 9 protein [bacterium]|nr:glycosyltransferase family 9 protein [bacterium]